MTWLIHRFTVAAMCCYYIAQILVQHMLFMYIALKGWI